MANSNIAEAERLDIGCGLDKVEGCVGLDANGDLEGVDVEHKVESGVELPFEENRFELIYINNVVEHIDDIPWLMSEVHRVGKPNALVKIEYSHFSGRNAYNDTTHIHYLGLSAFDHYDPETALGKKYQYYRMFSRFFPFSIEKKKPRFKLGFVSPVIYGIIGTDLYESMPCRVLPISKVNLELRVLKESSQ